MKKARGWWARAFPCLPTRCVKRRRGERRKARYNPYCSAHRANTICHSVIFPSVSFSPFSITPTRHVPDPPGGQTRFCARMGRCDGRGRPLAVVKETRATNRATNQGTRQRRQVVFQILTWMTETTGMGAQTSNLTNQPATSPSKLHGGSTRGTSPEVIISPGIGTYSRGTWPCCYTNPLRKC